MLVSFISAYEVFFFLFLFFWCKFYNSIVDNYILNDKKKKNKARNNCQTIETEFSMSRDKTDLPRFWHCK